MDTGLVNADMEFMDRLMEYQLSGRYPDYADDLRKQTSREYAEYCISNIKRIDQCLRKKTTIRTFFLKDEKSRLF